MMARMDRSGDSTSCLAPSCKRRDRCGDCIAVSDITFSGGSGARSEQRVHQRSGLVEGMSTPAPMGSSSRGAVFHVNPIALARWSRQFLRDEIEHGAGDQPGVHCSD